MSETMDLTAAVMRGVARMLYDRGMVSLAEVPLRNGRRADLVALDKAGLITIVEVKASLADFRADSKWPDYLDYCDACYFAAPCDLALRILDANTVADTGTGVIAADGHGGEILRTARMDKLAGARRTHLIRRLARLGARRVMALSGDLSARPDAGLSTAPSSEVAVTAHNGRKTTRQY